MRSITLTLATVTVLGYAQAASADRPLAYPMSSQVAARLGISSMHTLQQVNYYRHGHHGYHHKHRGHHGHHHGYYHKRHVYHHYVPVPRPAYYRPYYVPYYYAYPRAIQYITPGLSLSFGF